MRSQVPPGAPSHPTPRSLPSAVDLPAASDGADPTHLLSFMPDSSPDAGPWVVCRARAAPVQGVSVMDGMRGLGVPKAASWCAVAAGLKLTQRFGERLEREEGSRDM